MKCPFRAALMRSIRGYHMHQRTGRVEASVGKSHDIGLLIVPTNIDVRIVDLLSYAPISFDDEHLLRRGLAWAIENSHVFFLHKQTVEHISFRYFTCLPTSICLVFGIINSAYLPFKWRFSLKRCRFAAILFAYPHGLKCASTTPHKNK